MFDFKQSRHFKIFFPQYLYFYEILQFSNVKSLEIKGNMSYMCLLNMGANSVDLNKYKQSHNALFFLLMATC